MLKTFPGTLIPNLFALKVSKMRHLLVIKMLIIHPFERKKRKNEEK